MPKILEFGFLEGRPDLVLIPRSYANPRLTAEVLFKEPFQLVTPKDHPLAKLKKVKAAHLKGQNTLTLEKQYSSYTMKKQRV